MKLIRNGFARVAVAVAFLITLVASAQAQPNGLGTGSCLVFPYVNASSGAETLITITNTNRSTEYCSQQDTRDGDVALHFVYVDGETVIAQDLYDYLTPGDTNSYLVGRHNPSIEEGYLVIIASLFNVEQYGEAIDFDHLVGSALVVESGFDVVWSYQPYAFDAPYDPGRCERIPTDIDQDGAVDFDGTEYSMLPDEIVIDGFFEEGGVVTNRLALVSFADRAHTSEVTMFIYNNVGQPTATLFEMGGFWSGCLSDLSFAAEHLRGDPEELSRQTGWVAIGGSRMLDRSGNAVRDASGGVAIAPVLGVFTQFVEPLGLALGQSLHHSGALDGLEFFTGNGDPQQN